jgi:hypothetical protein
VVDVNALTDQELYDLEVAVRAEVGRRRLVADADERAAVLNADYLRATGVADGSAWRQPQGAHDAYPVPFTVTHNGKTWENLTPWNVWQPGVSGWREVTTGPAAWVQPTGAHDAYPLGAQVTHAGFRWTSLIAANVWEPTTANAALWQKGAAA